MTAFWATFAPAFGWTAGIGLGLVVVLAALLVLGKLVRPGAKPRSVPSQKRAPWLN